MSDANTETKAADAPEETAAQKLRDRYDDKGKIVALSADQLEDFEEFASTFNETDPLTDWTQKVPQDAGFTGFAVVRTEDDKNRMIALPSREAFVQSMNAVTWAYNRFLRQILNVAQSVDASESQFITVDGTIKAKYDITAFKSQAMDVVKWLRKQGLQGMTVPGLRAALASAPTAMASFPRVKPDQWQALLSRMIQLAEQKGHDTSLLQFWQATRDAKEDVGEEVVFDLEGFSLEDDNAGENAAAA